MKQRDNNSCRGALQRCAHILPDYQRGSCIATGVRYSAYTTSPFGYLKCDEIASLGLCARCCAFECKGGFFVATPTLNKPCDCRIVYCVCLLFLFVCCFPSVPPTSRKSTQLSPRLCYARACANLTQQRKKEKRRSLSRTLEYGAARQELRQDSTTLLRSALFEFLIQYRSFGLTPLVEGGTGQST